jgi:hypothetical protein
MFGHLPIHHSRRCWVFLTHDKLLSVAALSADVWDEKVLERQRLLAACPKRRGLISD